MRPETFECSVILFRRALFLPYHQGTSPNFFFSHLSLSPCLSRSHSVTEPCSLATLQDIVGTQSTWTIDLVFLLHGYGVKASMHTQCVGVNDAYRGLEFYKNDIGEDERRVNRLFAAAREASIPVLEEPVPLLTLQRSLLDGSATFIVLVDLRYLRCTSCTRKRPLFCFQYMGHFIVLCDYDSVTDTFTYRDPGCGVEACYIKSADLEVARLSVGTDQDLVIVPNPPTPPSSPTFSAASSMTPPSRSTSLELADDPDEDKGTPSPPPS